MKLFFRLLALILTLVFFSGQTVSATYNPLSVQNNRYGIHVISATREEASEAARLVNNNGDWGYITVLAESKDRNEQKWQEFFNELRRRHLIPLVRIATKPDGNSGNWERPYEGEETAWADFLDKLIWPTKNRYVILYNEPNHGSEWGGSVDPEGFAVTVSKTIDALKTKSEDFFVLNSGFDASTPNQPPRYLDQEEFMKRMNAAVPGIFQKFDGWVSHSYPNPGFIGKPTDRGRGTVRTWEWELELLNAMGVKKVLPVFITETGWKHSDGINTNNNFPNPEKVAEYYKEAFNSAWANNRIVAVTPFLLNYQQPPFDHFSFKKNGNLEDAEKDYHLPFYILQDAQKISGKPVQTEKAEFTKLGIEKDGFANYFEATSSGTTVTLAYDEPYVLKVNFKNTGQSIWGESGNMSLNVFGTAEAFGQTRFEIPADKKVEPGQEITFDVPISALPGGEYKTSFNLFNGLKPLLPQDYIFNIDVKAPVYLNIAASLKWKKDYSGNYFLGILGKLRYALSSATVNATLDSAGKSENLETKYLLPDQEYVFTLEKPYYKPKSIHQKIVPGENVLNFGELQPDLRSAMLKPDEFWKLLPWSD
jgi:hypothetical protein